MYQRSIALAIDVRTPTAPRRRWIAAALFAVAFALCTSRPARAEASAPELPAIVAAELARIPRELRLRARSADARLLSAIDEGRFEKVLVRIEGAFGRIDPGTVPDEVLRLSALLDILAGVCERVGWRGLSFDERHHEWDAVIACRLRTAGRPDLASLFEEPERTKGGPAERALVAAVGGELSRLLVEARGRSLDLETGRDLALAGLAHATLLVDDPGTARALAEGIDPADPDAADFLGCLGRIYFLWLARRCRIHWGSNCASDEEYLTGILRMRPDETDRAWFGSNFLRLAREGLGFREMLELDFRADWREPGGESVDPAILPFRILRGEVDPQSDPGRPWEAPHAWARVMHVLDATWSGDSDGDLVLDALEWASSIEPDNALYDYLEASLILDAGDRAGALASMDLATGKAFRDHSVPCVTGSAALGTGPARHALAHLCLPMPHIEILARLGARMAGWVKGETEDGEPAERASDEEARRVASLMVEYADLLDRAPATAWLDLALAFRVDSATGGLLMELAERLGEPELARRGRAIRLRGRERRLMFEVLPHASCEEALFCELLLPEDRFLARWNEMIARGFDRELDAQNMPRLETRVRENLAEARRERDAELIEVDALWTAGRHVEAYARAEEILERTRSLWPLHFLRLAVDLESGG